jgi:hypothetical protein
LLQALLATQVLEECDDLGAGRGRVEVRFRLLAEKLGERGLGAAWAIGQGVEVKTPSVMRRAESTTWLMSPYS